VSLALSGYEVARAKGEGRWSVQLTQCDEAV